MPAIVIRGFGTLPSVPIPSLRSYLTFSSFIFLSGFYYYYMVIKSANISSPFGNGTEAPDGTTALPMTIDTLRTVLGKHPLLYYVLLNTLCAFIMFIGHLGVDLVVGPTTTQENVQLHNMYLKVMQYKFVYTLLVSSNGIFEDFVNFLPWMLSYLVATTMLKLIDGRVSNPQHATAQHVTIFRAVACVIWIIGMTLLAGFNLLFVNNLDSAFSVLMILDCVKVFICGVHVLQKIHVLVTRPLSDTASVYMSLFHSMSEDLMDVFSVYHVYRYGHSWPTIACILMVMQFRLSMLSVADTLKKYVRHQRIVAHINETYPEATKEDLLKHDSCTICWDLMDKARKLPCGHIFHEVCLRRWLQQDSSCAVCRTALSLHLNQLLRDDIQVEDEIGTNTLRDIVRLARWINRDNFEPALSQTQVDDMTLRIRNIFPQYAENAVVNAVRLTGNLDLAVDYLLANVQGPAGDGHAEEDAGLDSDSSAESYTVDDAPAAPEAQAFQLPSSSRPTYEDNSNDSWFVIQRRRLIDDCRRKYLASARADDLQAGFSTGSKKAD
uniref:RING-type domain-containing protein n=1 Tax=Panagrellus redivivus TaxID=6233 RepID=A0A7E4VNB6_PANRE